MALPNRPRFNKIMSNFRKCLRYIDTNNMKYTLFLFLFFLSMGNLYCQYTQIPDAEFELRLVGLGIDTEGTIDGQVLTDDIDHITILNVSTAFPEIDPLINDLTGIEDFVALEDLHFVSNNITSINLSQNVNLKLLNCKINNLTELDISNNILLEQLDAANCFPGTCDQENTFTELDVSNNTILWSFYLTNSNTVQSIDLSNNPLLTTIGISRNTILNSLNLKNGNNVNLTNLQAVDNPNLSCIEVDDPVAANEGITPPYDAWVVEEGTFFSKDCTFGVGDAFLQDQISLFPNPAQDTFTLRTADQISIEKVSLYDVQGRPVVIQPIGNKRFDISLLAAGMYLVRLETNLDTATKYLVVQ